MENLFLLGGIGRAEAQENRNFLITRIIDDILEIMRVLQLKVYDEEEAEDPTVIMRKAQGIIAGKMDQAKDWLGNPSADANGLGMLYRYYFYNNCHLFIYSRNRNFITRIKLLMLKMLIALKIKYNMC